MIENFVRIAFLVFFHVSIVYAIGKFQRVCHVKMLISGIHSLKIYGFRLKIAGMSIIPLFTLHHFR